MILRNNSTQYYHSTRNNFIQTYQSHCCVFQADHQEPDSLQMPDKDKQVSLTW